MSGISEIQSRIHTIQNRAASPPISGRFNAVFAAEMAAVGTKAASAPAPIPGAVAGENDETLVAVQAQRAEPAPGLGSTAVTLGMMLGISSGPATHRVLGSVLRSQELTAYLQTNRIEERNGQLGPAELVAVSGGWNGSARLLPPAAGAWEQMRADAAADGVDLKAIDSYRSWEVQEGAYQAHLRGEKKANVLPPGQSEHGNGLAVDITNGHLVGVGDREYTWLRTYAAQYGWYPISNESWHWEFRGT